MGSQPTRDPQRGRSSPLGWRIAGWLIVAGAVALAIALVQVIPGGSVREAHHHQPVSRADHRRAAQKPFSYCGDRRAVFSGAHPFVGLNDSLTEYHTIQRACPLGLIAANHLGYFRGTLYWSLVEPTPGTYDFARYDAFIADLAEHHISFLPVLVGAPRWASTIPLRHPWHGMYPPAQPSQFAAFAAMCVRRYGPRGAFWRDHPGLPYYPVRAWQIWNEPDLLQSWEPRPDPAAYVRLLRASHTAIKAVDPQAFVVAAGLAFFSAGRERVFLSELFHAGMAGYFDALAIHSYSPVEAPQRLELARQLMDKFGVSDAQLWATELAWASGPPDPWAVNPATQASAIRSFFGWVANNRRRLGLGEVMWFSLRDHVYGPDPTWWGYHLGLLTAARQPKPGLAALAVAAKTLDR